MRLSALLALAALAILARPASAGDNFAFGISFGSGWRTPAPVVTQVCAPVAPCAPVVCAPVACAPVVCAPAPVRVHQGGWRGGRKGHWRHAHDSCGQVVVQQPVVVQQSCGVQQTVVHSAPVVCAQPVVIAPAAPCHRPVVPVYGQYVQTSYGWRR